MKIFIMLYARQNLGDDLFVKMILEKYPKEQFFINFVDEKYSKIIEKYNNVEIINKNKENFEEIDINLYDGFIYVGGSIFMEGGKVYNLDEGCNSFMKECKKNNKPFFYVSSNFGPYQTEEYFKLCQDTFKNCTDLCFRDLYSYNLFKDIESVRYAPDLAFSYDAGQIKIEKNSIGISVIDLRIRKEKYKETIYNQMMVNNIIKYIETGNKVYLFSFCKVEGDEESILRIKELLPNKYKESVEIVNYDGNIDEFMEIYKRMEYMICARFHAMVLSYVCKQKFYVMSYSKKIDNVIKELELCKEENYCNIEDISSDMMIEKSMFKEIDEDNLNKIKEESKKQLTKIDEWINNK